MSRKAACHFYNKPGGCRKGSHCTYAHIGQSGSSPPSGATSNQDTPSTSTPANPRENNNINKDIPRGVCAFYWRTGECTRGFQCRYKHEQGSPENATAAMLGRSPTGVTIPAMLAPFLNSAALARLVEPGTDALFTLNPKPRSPSEVHNLLKRFLIDGYSFRTVYDMYAFAGLLTDATSHNTSWTTEDGQLLLTAIAKDNGLLRVNDILTWDKVSIRAGNDRTVLSFQRAYIPLLQYFSSDFVVKSVMSHLINALYMLLMEHFDSFAEKVQACMDQAVNESKTFNEAGLARPIGGSQVFGALAVVLLQCLTRVKNATAKYPRLRTLVHDSKKLLDTWTSSVSATPPTFTDALTSSPANAREQICKHLKDKYEQLVAIVDREYGKIQRVAKKSQPSIGNSEEGTLAALHNSYVGPGVARTEGPRHDNDHVDIADIRIAPTHEELICRIPPFLPANIYGAPHPLPPESPERLLDIQYRLLREELTAPLRSSVQQILDDLQSTRRKTQLDELMQRGGGKYRGHSDSQDSILFNLYTNVAFSQILPDRKGISVDLSLDTPPGRARAPEPNRRAAFWEGMSGKRLLSGGLVAFIWKSVSSVEVHLGVISSTARDHVSSARQSASRISIRVAFFDPRVELRILQELRRPVLERAGTKLLIEATVMFAAVRPFLEALRVEPTSVPFMRYLVHRPPGTLSTMPIEPPGYAMLPDFTFQLASLFGADAGIDDLKLSVTDAESVRTARELLRAGSCLDPSQADAVIDALTREVALIQGPPGTGKTYTGIQFLRILVENGVGPILMIAFTNHALDHLLCSVLDAGITKKIVRLGSRSADERISQFNIEAMEEVAGRSRLDRAFSNHHRELKQVESEVKDLMKECLRTTVDTPDILRHIEVASPVHFQDFLDVPGWIDVLYQVWKQSTDDGGGWMRVSRSGRGEEIDDSMYGYWLAGGDLEFLQLSHAPKVEKSDDLVNNTPVQPTSTTTSSTGNQYQALADHVVEPPAEGSSEDADSDADSDEDSDEDLLPEEAWMKGPAEPDSADLQVAEDVVSPTVTTPPTVPSQEPVAPSLPQDPVSQESGSLRPADFHDVQDFFSYFGYRQAPPVPAGDRPLGILLDVDGVWSMSRSERLRLHKYWTDEVQIALQENRIQEFERLRRKYSEALDKYNEGKAASRCQLLKNVDIIGCTTTGAANLTGFLKAIGPKVMLVEEAGQVLEAHILGSLVPSVQHLIMIGDPQQLRPTLNNYSLSMDHRSGSLVYKFDMSLMERLSSSGFPMSQIDVQRRMRPTISELVRTTLYPKLEDHDLVQQYPPVHGMAKNVFFLSHNHKENGGEDESVSKYNAYEVDMIVDLVMYLLRQGAYGGEGDIVVLCAYLGQLARVRDAFGDKVAVVIDERDQRELADREAETDDVAAPTSLVEHVKVSRRVRIRTIDNYQGEEAKIVILSLVRNSGGAEEDEAVHGHSNMTRANIGFLRSDNRTNVALSRAREGLYILGNDRDLAARSKMWRTVISTLKEDDCVGNAFPVACHRHRDKVQYISKPGQLPRIAPDGGCLRQCDARLTCGHLCPFKCHSDDPNHVAVSCAQRCTRLCPRGHPCTRSCADPCGKCLTLVPNVELPCGHIKAQVTCAFLDDLSEVPCDAIVRKKLLECDHEADMGCSDDPEQYQCTIQCGGIMECCGRNCGAPCFRCQVTIEEEDGVNRFKMVHSSHPCQKPLYCEHPCNKPCSVDHECATLCQAPCRQICVHARCRQTCSTLCAPCQEPCTWQCPHQTCQLPCGSICARLPCDIRCSVVLRCGHRCPSVCGEDCSIQVCPECASEEQKDTVVDLILQRSLADVDPDMETVDDMLITIPNCGHVFTVETLDGHLAMTEYYVQNPSGAWTGLKAPSTGFLKPPMCPTCRAPITCPRYGRIFKRADLDILENNAASHMSHALSGIAVRLGKLSQANLEERLRAEASNPNITTVKPPAGALKKEKDRKRKQNAKLREARRTPIATASLDPADDIHDIPIPECRAWRSVTRALLTAYREATEVAATRSSHTHAWEASFSYLYQKEMDAAVQDPEHAPRNPQEHAMRMARMLVGQPQPRADMRFMVEAFWTAINIRLTLVELGKVWIAALSSRPSYPSETKHMWELYVFFILRSCTEDARRALNITRESESHRQAAKTSLLLMRIDFEQFRFNVETMQNSSKFGEHRHEIADRAASKRAAAREQASDTVKAHKEVARNDNTREMEWLESNFNRPAQKIIDEWEKLERSLRMATFYQPVSMKEIEDIVRGLNFSHTGHFYKCPNGHTFVIADCGGAVHQSFCPECGAPIGGTGHQLLSSNSRAMEFEEVARAQGALRSPWNWGV